MIKKPTTDEIQANIKNAIDQLERQDFVTYIKLLDILGNQVFRYHHSQFPNCQPRSSKNDKKAFIQWATETYQPMYELSNPLAFCAFEEAWVDDYLREPISVDHKTLYRRYLSPKAHLNRSTRQNINLAMRIIAQSIRCKKRPRFISPEDAIHYDKQATNAIKNYQIKKHRILNYIGLGLAMIITFVFSITMTAAVVSFIAFWPLPWVAVIGSVFFVGSCIFYWFGARNLVPRTLINLFGRDRLFEGWTYYHDEETGEKKQLSLKRKIALGFLGVLSTILSIATGIMTYSFIIHLGQLTLFTVLIAGGALSCALPPVGISIAIAIGIGYFIYFMYPLVNALQSKHAIHAFKKPFQDAMWIFDSRNPHNTGKSLLRLHTEKAIAFTLVGILSVLTFVGLLILQIQYGSALALWMYRILAISSTIAIGITDAISTIAAFIGQLPYTLKFFTRSMVTVISGARYFFSHPKNQNKQSIITVDKLSETFKAPETSYKQLARERRLNALQRLTQVDVNPTPASTFEETKLLRHSGHLFNDPHSDNDTSNPLSPYSAPEAQPL